LGRKRNNPEAKTVRTTIPQTQELQPKIGHTSIPAEFTHSHQQIKGCGLLAQRANSLDHHGLHNHAIKDWTFLRRRAQQLSEKAKENVRQEQEAQGEEIMNVEKAAEAVAAVEHLQDYESIERKAKQAQAAQARFQQQEPNADWKLVTPCEPDRDELRECIERAPPPPSSDMDVATIITRLMKEHHIHNWRELANVTDVESLATRLDISTENVQQWIDKAQDESVSEIMVEICDGNVDAVQILTKKARTGTPKDLAGWRCIPELLHEQTGSPSTTSIDKAQLSTWCQRAHRVLQDWE
jgi:hypothetical protein